jgi:hypothetical protein
MVYLSSPFSSLIHLADCLYVAFFLLDGVMLPEYSIEASHITELKIAPPVAPQIIAPPSPPIPSGPPEFQDPAILSVGSSDE